MSPATAVHRAKGDVRALLRRFLRPGQTAVDVGAAVGEMSAIMAACVGQTGCVYAFEPSENKRTQFDKAIRESQSQATVICRHVALGECEGECRLYRPTSTGASRWHGDEQGAITVPMTTLDSALQQVESIDLVKIDTQGSEGHILDGAQSVLCRCPIWIVEIWPWGLGTAGRTARSVIDQLRSAGLTPYWAEGDRIDDDGISQFTAIPKTISHANIYAVR